jgi:hypothetical protein
MVPGKYNIVCPQGSTLSQQLTYSIDDVDVNLTGYSARMQVREKHTSTSTVLSLTNSNGGIVLGGVAGTINIVVTATQSSELTAKEYVYDLELVSSGNIVTRLIEGKFIVTPEVTR